METVSLLVAVQNVSKQYGAAPLFRGISFSVADGDRVGLIGPNGSGKSTLLQILAGRNQPDEGTVSFRRDLRIGLVEQEPKFAPAATPRHILTEATARGAVPPEEQAGLVAETLGKAGFAEFDVPVEGLSGGWRKRLAVAEALAQNPDLLLLDEPTNHLDLEGVEWLERLLAGSRFACMVVSHDRYFLQNVALSMLEVSAAYPDGLYRCAGNYQAFLEQKSAFLVAQERRQEAVENRVRTEIEWLRRGPKARATKAKARIDRANELIGELADLRSRAPGGAAQITFAASGRKTKRLIEADGITKEVGGRSLFRDLSFAVTPGKRIGLVGPNGSGKSTLLAVLAGVLAPDAGRVRHAEELRLLHFEQIRSLDPAQSLRQALAPDGDSVIYQGRVIHVAAWASRFLFSAEQLSQPVARLSGGERARVLIARLMLRPADVLFLDEPTNDLDIPTLEILEESLLEFEGAVVLVTHDRFLLDRVSTEVVGLDGTGRAGVFADYRQWETWKQEQGRSPKPAAPAAGPKTPAASAGGKRKLSYLDHRDYESIEARIGEAERVLAEKRSELDRLEVATNPERLQRAISELAEAEMAVDTLYQRWAELEAKLS